MQSAGTTEEFILDPKYEFSAPRFFDFCAGETQEEASAAELWFYAAPSHPASPFIGKVKSVRELSMGCTLEEYIEVQKLVVRLSSELPIDTQDGYASVNVEDNNIVKETVNVEDTNIMKETVNVGNTNIVKETSPLKEINVPGPTSNSNKTEPSSPKHQLPHHFAELKSNNNNAHIKQNLPLKRTYSELKKQDAGKNIKTLQSNGTTTLKRCLDGFQKMDIADDKQTAKKQRIEEYCVTTEKREAKKQKLDGGRSYQVPRPAPTLTVPQEFHFYTEKRAHIHRETGHCNSNGQGSGLPYIPVAEMVQRFQTNLLGDFRTQETATSSRGRNLKLTRPKEPHLGTSMRARPPTVKSSAEREEEMLAQLPKFKARPLNKRILEAPTLPLPHRSTPHLPEFQEFNLRTMERALIHQQAIPLVDNSVAPQNIERIISSKGEFHLETGVRARPPRYKTTQEIEGSTMMTQFKARPLDKRIFSSRGDVGVFTVMKRQPTIPKEFQFATDQRAHQHETLLLQVQQHQEDYACSYLKTETSKQMGEHRNVRVSTSRLNGLHVFNDNQHVHPRTDLNAEMSQRTSLSTVERSRKPLLEVQKYSIAPEATAFKHTKPYQKNTSIQGYHEQEDVNAIVTGHHRKSAFHAQPNLDCDSFPVHTRPAKEILQVLSPSVHLKEHKYSDKRSFLPVHHMR